MGQVASNNRSTPVFSVLLHVSLPPVTFVISLIKLLYMVKKVIIVDKRLEQQQQHHTTWSTRLNDVDNVCIYEYRKET